MGVLKSFLDGMTVAVLLTGLNVWLEHTELGGRLRAYTYEEIHRWLETDELGVGVVDISTLPVTTREDGTQVTSRQALRDVLATLAEGGARGIALDVDLSPSNASGLHPEDQAFLEDLQKLPGESSKVPNPSVFVGVHRTRLEGPDRWLGEPRFANLAADMQAKESRIPTVLTWLVSPAATRPLWGLGASLGRVRHGSLPEEPSDWSRLLRVNAIESSGAGAPMASGMLVDTSSLDALVAETIHLTAPGQQGFEMSFVDQLRRREVLEFLRRRPLIVVGAADPRESRDKDFFIPGKDAPYPGVYLHACAAQTFENGYLREVTPLGTIVADLVLALFVFGGIAGTRMGLALLRRNCPPPMALFLVLLGMSVVLTVFGWIFAAVSLRILWDGLPFVLLAAVIHLVLEVIMDLRHAAHASAASVGHSPAQGEVK